MRSSQKGMILSTLGNTCKRPCISNSHWQGLWDLPVWYEHWDISGLSSSLPGFLEPWHPCTHSRASSSEPPPPTWQVPGALLPHGPLLSGSCPAHPPHSAASMLTPSHLSEAAVPSTDCRLESASRQGCRPGGHLISAGSWITVLGCLAARPESSCSIYVVQFS